MFIKIVHVERSRIYFTHTRTHTHAQTYTYKHIHRGIGVCLEDKTDILSFITPSHSCDVYGICKTTRSIGHRYT